MAKHRIEASGRSRRFFDVSDEVAYLILACEIVAVIVLSILIAFSPLSA